MMRFKINWEKVQQKISSIIEKPALTSFVVLIFLSFIVLGLSANYYLNDFNNFIRGVLEEAHGMLFDLAIIGILIYWLNENGAKRLRIRTYKDEIDDFRLWESEEAAFRTVGNIKRLNRHKIYNINLVNCYLAKTNLSYVILKGSNLNSANVSNSNLVQCNLEGTRLNQTNFENSNLNHVFMQKAYASGANFKDTFMIKAKLDGAFLIKANFCNAFLMESDLNGAYLTGANLENANFYKADLRNCIGLTVDQLAQAKTLYLAQFDQEIMERLNAEHAELLGK